MKSLNKYWWVLALILVILVAAIWWKTKKQKPELRIDVDWANQTWSYTTNVGLDGQHDHTFEGADPSGDGNWVMSAIWISATDITEVELSGQGKKVKRTINWLQQSVT